MRSYAFPRKVVISPGYGAGMHSWWEGDSERLYDMVESEALINAVEEKLTWKQACVLMVKAGFDEFPEFYPGGWDQAVVIEVNSPYIIEEHDGSEYVITHNDTSWRV
jgi:hypothetical protein